MDYEKAYKEALGLARKIHSGEGVAAPAGWSTLETIFPELRESEDERIRKWIKNELAKRYVEDGIVNSIDADKAFAWLEKQKEQIPYIDFVIKPHKGDDNNPYDMRVSEAQEYAIKRGFGIPFNDGEVYVDERHLTQTIGNILRWADEHPKEQKPAWSEEDETHLGWIIDCLEYWKNRVPDFADQYQSAIDWLKSLRPVKQEWSKKDEDKLYQVMETLLSDKTVALRETPHCKALHEAYDEMLAWLKSLRSSWKPSDEQMEALEECGECKRCIKELRVQLKKL